MLLQDTHGLGQYSQWPGAARSTKVEAILITGSAAGVYDEFDRIAPLEGLTRSLRRVFQV